MRAALSEWGRNDLIDVFADQEVDLDTFLVMTESDLGDFLGADDRRELVRKRGELQRGERRGEVAEAAFDAANPFGAGGLAAGLRDYDEDEDDFDDEALRAEMLALAADRGLRVRE